MSEESPITLKVLPDTQFVSEALPYHGLKSRTALPEDQETLDEKVSKKPVINLAGAPDGGLTAWLVVVASVPGYTINLSSLNSH
jgi:MCP family monocarboxylic acid transporter-like MFS transporter 10